MLQEMIDMLPELTLGQLQILVANANQQVNKKLYQKRLSDSIIGKM